MKQSFLLICVLSLLAACNGTAKKATLEAAVQPVNLILDTDLGPDYDDVGGDGCYACTSRQRLCEYTRNLVF